jgi:hypothetical protein
MAAGLARAEQDIVEAKARIEKQRDLIEKLEGRGAPEALLGTMLISLVLFEQHRDLIAADLERAADDARDPGRR